MGKCATKKTVRRFADGGSATDIAGLLAGTNIYDNGAGTTTGVSGATHLTSTNASTAVPVPGQQAIGQMPSATGVPNPATQSNRDSSPLGKLDQDIAMGTAMGQMSNTERYQMANPGNQTYTIGQPQGRGRGEQPGMVSSTPGSSADASMLNQKTSLMSSLRNKLADQPLYAGYASGGEVKETPEQLMARMAAKYGTGGGTPTVSAPVAAPRHVAAPVAQSKVNTIGGAIGALKNRAAQIDAISGFANGGKIKGPGTSTSDSIQAKVTDTGEPIAVSTGERIVSKAQDALLQKIASGMGYDSLDAMLEAGTGKPVGPTIKGGMAHASGGATPEQLARNQAYKENESAAADKGMLYRLTHNSYDPTPEQQARINAAIKATPAPENDVAAKLSTTADLATLPGRLAVHGIESGANAITGQPSKEFEAKPFTNIVAPTQAVAPSPVKPTVAPQVSPSVLGDQGRGVPANHRAETGSNQPFAPVRDTGYNHGVPIPEQNFTANEQQIAQPSGAIQGKSNVDATQMTAPQGGGYITNRAGKSMMLEPQAATAKDPNAQIDANGNNMAYTNQMKEQLVGMQRERLMRDMGSDITSQGTRVAAHQQLAQMDKDQGMAMLAHRSQRDDATAGLDQQLKGQQIAQLTQDADLKTKVMAGDPAAIEMWNRIHPPKPDQLLVVPDGEAENENGNVIRRPNRVVNARTQQDVPRAGVQASPAIGVGTPVKAADGTHTFQGKTITVKDGKVTGVK